LSGGGVDFASTVNGPFSLTVNAPAILGGAVGNLTALTSLTLDDAAALDGPSVRTSGAQNYDGPVTLSTSGGIVTLEGTGIDFATTVVAAGGTGLSVMDAGYTTFGGTVGAGPGNALGSLTTAGLGVTINGNITTTGAQAYNDPLTLSGDGILTLTGNNIDFASTVNAPGGASLVVADSGTTQLGGNVSTGTGSQTYKGQVTLDSSVTLTGANVTFASTINAEATDDHLDLTIKAGLIELGGNIGIGTLPNSIGYANELDNVTIDGTIDVTKSPGIVVLTTGLQEYGYPGTDRFIGPNILLADDESGLFAYNDIGFDLALDEVIKGVFTTLQEKRKPVVRIEAEAPPQESGPPLYGEYLMRSGEVAK
jgi:hypothetical protein